jgi:3-hydroxyacyl-[acyl-carrier-protein] dehydratase
MPSDRKELVRDAKGSLLDINEIMKHLPHRYPFILVDKIVEFDFDKRTIVGHKNVTINEPFFQGHFPGVPIMPGVLILEALAQVGGILIHLLGLREEHRIALLLSVNEAKFRAPVIPGDVLSLRCEGVHCTTKGGKVKAEAYVGDKIAAQAEIGFVLVDKNQI